LGHGKAARSIMKVWQFLKMTKNNKNAALDMEQLKK
jgi:hypothetical protein